MVANLSPISECRRREMLSGAETSTHRRRNVRLKSGKSCRLAIQRREMLFFVAHVGESLADKLGSCDYLSDRIFEAVVVTGCCISLAIFGVQQQKSELFVHDFAQRRPHVLNGAVFHFASPQRESRRAAASPSLIHPVDGTGLVL